LSQRGPRAQRIRNCKSKYRPVASLVLWKEWRKWMMRVESIASDGGAIALPILIYKVTE
jgi:hypothetical protein